jgi:hypothetical protein
MAWRRRGIPRISMYPIISRSVLKLVLSCDRRWPKSTTQSRTGPSISVPTTNSPNEAWHQQQPNTQGNPRTFSNTRSLDSLFSATASGM